MKIVTEGISWRMLLAGLVTVVLVGCASAPVLPARIPDDPRLDTYVIGVPDLLAVTVWEQPDLSGEVLVRRDGKISLALAGDVVAAGNTP